MTPALIPAPRSQERGRSLLCKILVHFTPQVGLGSSPDILRQATSRTRCLLLRQSNGNTVPLPLRKAPPVRRAFPLPTNAIRLCGVPIASGKEFLPSFLEFGTTVPLDPPALLAGHCATDAFGVVSDFTAGLAKERICIFVDCLHLLPSGSPTPAFSAVFRPVCGFHEAGGILTLPQRRKWHTGATAGFAISNLRNLRKLRKFYGPDFCEECEVSEGGTYQTSSTLPGVESV